MSIELLVFLEKAVNYDVTENVTENPMLLKIFR